MRIFYIITFLLCFPDVSWGYIEPGSVTILLQVILAFLLGGLITFKKKVGNGIKSLTRLFLQKKKGPSNDK